MCFTKNIKKTFKKPICLVNLSTNHLFYSEKQMFSTKTLNNLQKTNIFGEFEHKPLVLLRKNYVFSKNTKKPSKNKSFLQKHQHTCIKTKKTKKNKKNNVLEVLGGCRPRPPEHLFLCRCVAVFAKTMCFS